MGTGGQGLLKDAGPAGPPLLPGPLPMEAIEKMASLCMRDPDEEEEGTDEEDVEADDDLLVSALGRVGGPLLWLSCPAGPHPQAPTHCVSLGGTG